jgi:type II secretory ATPase GspE/PulE/Tfp pilus assembly ATPase PilB-like protein
LNGVTQVPVNVKSGVTFASVLRSILRQDPDVLMVGEMRDRETAKIAVQAAMTGHLVFSTLHTNDAASAVARLTDLGVESYMIAAALECVLAQRLVRTTCSDCRETYEPEPQAIASLTQQPVGRIKLQRGRGCGLCRETGYLGRTGIFELLVVTDSIKTAIATSDDTASLREQARQEGMTGLRADGWRAVSAGFTTVEEVLRVVQV